MDTTRARGAAALVIGVVFIGLGYDTQPRHMLTVVTGVLFVIAGILLSIRMRTR